AAVVTRSPHTAAPSAGSQSVEPVSSGDSTYSGVTTVSATAPRDQPSAAGRQTAVATVRPRRRRTAARTAPTRATPASTTVPATAGTTSRWSAHHGAG